LGVLAMPPCDREILEALISSQNRL
jgi:hypothetical protein